MGLIVDTNVFIDVENGRLDLASLTVLQSQPLFIAAITMSELLAGVKLAKTPDAYMRRHSFTENILGSVPVLDFDAEVARIYADLYADALGNSRRSKINVHDLQIAATGLVHGYSILTSNVDDFNDAPGVRVIDPYSEGGQGVHEEAGDYA